MTQEMMLAILKLLMPERLCEGYLVGKQSNNSFKPYLPMGSTSILEVIHSYVCGPLKTIQLVEIDTFFLLWMRIVESYGCI